MPFDAILVLILLPNLVVPETPPPQHPSWEGLSGRELGAMGERSLPEATPIQARPHPDLQEGRAAGAGMGVRVRGEKVMNGSSSAIKLKETGTRGQRFRDSRGCLEPCVSLYVCP